MLLSRPLVSTCDTYQNHSFKMKKAILVLYISLKVNFFSLYSVNHSNLISAPFGKTAVAVIVAVHGNQ